MQEQRLELFLFVCKWANNLVILRYANTPLFFTTGKLGLEEVCVQSEFHARSGTWEFPSCCFINSIRLLGLS